MTLSIRQATGDDLEGMWAVYNAADPPGEGEPPRPFAVPPHFRHVMAHGLLLAAEIDGALAGYAGFAERSGSTFLTDLFVHPERQSGSVGRTLLETGFAAVPGNRLTVASTDPRAISLYTRFGMTPLWPNLLLEGDPAELREIPVTGLTIEPGDLDGAIALDAETGGRRRPEDFAYWLASDGELIGVRSGAETAGYAVIRAAAPLIAVGPVLAARRENARGVALEAVRHAAKLGRRMELAVPGPHPALPALLDLRFRITYLETYCASDSGLVDPERFISSGGDLF